MKLSTQIKKTLENKFTNVKFSVRTSSGCFTSAIWISWEGNLESSLIRKTVRNILKMKILH